ncbi:MAG: inorganic diphosphatase [Candidatus Cardinium sp.]|nr:inorganic diphosphatase [Candidatus Cardinium sp.]
MYIDRIAVGTHFPDDVNVIVEIPMHYNTVKYEMDKVSGALCVDRFIQTAMYYPCNYGFIPHTVAGDGDPVDALVITSYPIMPAACISTRPIGILLMKDESGPDEKIITLPTTKIAPEFAHIEDIEQVDPLLKKRIIHFFNHYKELEQGKWVKIEGFESKKKAMTYLIDAASKNEPYRQ